MRVPYVWCEMNSAFNASHFIIFDFSRFLHGQPYCMWTGLHKMSNCGEGGWGVATWNEMEYNINHYSLVELMTGKYVNIWNTVRILWYNATHACSKPKLKNSLTGDVRHPAYKAVAFTV